MLSNYILIIYKSNQALSNLKDARTHNGKTTYKVVFSKNT